MKLTQMAYHRVFNLGNFQSERIELTAELDEKDDPEQVMGQLKHHVDLMKSPKDVKL